MYQFDSTIRYSEVDADCNLTIPALMNYFQDCTTFHSETVGNGVKALAKRKQAWMLSFYQICIKQMPKFLDEVTISTYPYEIKGFYGFRNFCVTDKKGNRCAYANSIWVLMDITTGRPAKVTQDVIEAYGQDEKLDMEYCDRKLLIPQEVETKEKIVVPSFFIDSNHHMNNEKYVMLAAEYVPNDFKVSELRVEYKKEAKWKDVIIPVVAREEKRITVGLLDESRHPYAIVAFLEK